MARHRSHEGHGPRTSTWATQPFRNHGETTEMGRRAAVDNAPARWICRWADGVERRALRSVWWQTVGAQVGLRPCCTYKAETGIAVATA